MKTSWLSENIKPLGFLIIMIGAIAYLFMVTLISNDVSIRSQALIAMISLATGAAGYYYGYSQGAAKKDEALTNIATQPTVQQAETVNVTTPNEQ